MLTTEPLTLTDDKILVQLGAAQESQTEEEKTKYVAGLKEIINNLRRDKVKDFNTVASEIAAYRRRFLQDPSRVLSL
jgi:phosphoenolpyruvate-protein kinase (PTS system EI component)